MIAEIYRATKKIEKFMKYLLLILFYKLFNEIYFIIY